MNRSCVRLASRPYLSGPACLRCYRNRRSAVLTTLFFAVAGLFFPGKAAADVLYASDIVGAQIYKVDKSTGALLQTISVSQPLDTLVFNSQGNIIYSAFSVGGVGQLRMVDPAVGLPSDTFLATVGNRAVDIALAPGGNSALVTSQITGKIYQVDLLNPGNPPATFGSGQYTGGIAFDSSGRLFAVSGSRIVQLDPTTFNVIANSATLAGLDGLAFDPFTGNLFASSRAVNSFSGREGFYELSLLPGTFLQAALITSSSFPTTFDPDGLEPDGQGNLYLASEAARGDNRIYQYDISTGKLTVLSGVLPGLDDLAPLAGSGAPPPPPPSGGATTVPEPSSLMAFAAGAIALSVSTRLRRRRSGA